MSPCRPASDARLSGHWCGMSDRAASRRALPRIRPHSLLGYHPPAPETVPMASSQICSGAGAAATAHRTSARINRWGPPVSRLMAPVALSAAACSFRPAAARAEHRCAGVHRTRRRARAASWPPCPRPGSDAGCRGSANHPERASGHGLRGGPEWNEESLESRALCDQLEIHVRRRSRSGGSDREASRVRARQVDELVDRPGSHAVPHEQAEWRGAEMRHRDEVTQRVKPNATIQRRALSTAARRSGSFPQSTWLTRWSRRKPPTELGNSPTVCSAWIS